MKNSTKIWLFAALSLVLIGCIIFVASMSTLNWDFENLSTSKYETNHYEIAESFENISISTDTADIVFVPSDSSVCRIECYELTNKRHSVIVTDGTLSVNINAFTSLIKNIGINFGTPKLTVFLPADEHGALNITASTGELNIGGDFKFESIDISKTTGDIISSASAYNGIKIKATTSDITIKNITADKIDVSVTTGTVAVSGADCRGELLVKCTTGKSVLADVTCKSFISDGTTGDISLRNLLATQTLSITRNTGDVELNACDAGEIFIKTTSGDVEGNLLTEKSFITQTTTGKIEIPRTASGGNCEITTTTGDIEIEIVGN